MYGYEPVSFRSSGLRIHYQLDIIDFSKRFEYSSQHFLGDVEMQRSDVQAHRPDHYLGHQVGHRTAHSILLGLRVLNYYRHSVQLLS